MTQRLYYQDSYCTEFDAAIVRSVPGAKGATGIILDRTCFYPTSGGQPCDHGALNDQPVYDVVEEGNDIIHWVRGTVQGPAVHGQIAWSRRLDHMQQHTGQHILSEACLKVLGAQIGRSGSALGVGMHRGLARMRRRLAPVWAG